MRQIPIPDASPAQQALIVTQGDRILIIKRTAPEADASAWEREIDRLVYALYGLSTSEIALVEETLQR